jgi:hypothetical protein
MRLAGKRCKRKQADGIEVNKPWERRQWTLEISTNAERHIQQIREIKNNPNFPRR